MVAFLQSGRNNHPGVTGEMTSVVGDTMHYMTDANVTAVARYLRHVATDANALDTPRLPASEATENGTAAMPLAASTDMDLGARLYLDNCNARHCGTGAGANGVFSRAFRKRQRAWRRTGRLSPGHP